VSGKIVTGYYPRKFQEQLHNAVKRFNVLVCHRRFGKTVFSINEMIDRGLRNPFRNPQYAYIAPTYQAAKRIAWDMIKDYTRDIPGMKVNEQDLRVDIQRPGGDRLRFMLLSAENPGSLRGIYLDGCILDEYAECDPTVWTQVVRPALADRKGWAIFIGTPKGQNHFYDVYMASKKSDQWFNAVFKASETGILDNEELEAARLTMSEEEYEQEFECSFQAALVGAYYGKQISKLQQDGRITRVPHDPSLSVDTYWDLGIGDCTAIWFIQSLRTEHHVIDYLEVSGDDLGSIIQKLREGDRKKYEYRDHVMPHDAAAREFQTGKSRQRAFYDLTRHNPHIVPRHNVDDGIHSVRQVLPLCVFDELKCERGLAALQNYEKKWNAKNKMFETKPKHNWASHGADAFRTFGMYIRPESTRQDRNFLPRAVENDYNIFDV
jgi:hypothetical protein